VYIHSLFYTFVFSVVGFILALSPAGSLARVTTLFPFFGRGFFIIVVLHRDGFSFHWNCHLVWKAEDSDLVRGCCK